MRALVLLILLGCAGASPDTTSTGPRDAPTLSDAAGPDITIRRVSDRVWLHDSVSLVSGYGLVHANGLLVWGRDGAVVVDSAWTPEQTRWLIERARDATGEAPRALIATHFHGDRAGGIEAARAAGVPVYASSATRTLLGARGEHVSHPFVSRAAIDLGDVHLEAFFPGAGHSPDNVVVYVAEEQILFGGCLVRADDSIGNLSDANVAAWPATMDRVIARYPDAKVVVPGHGAMGDASLLTHTRDLALAAE